MAPAAVYASQDAFLYPFLLSFQKITFNEPYRSVHGARDEYTFRAAKRAIVLMSAVHQIDEVLFR